MPVAPVPPQMLELFPEQQVPAALPQEMLPAPKPAPAPRKQATFNGIIESETLRFFNNGVARFKIRKDNPNEPLASCVMFRTASRSLPVEILSRAKRLEVRGFFRQNSWTDKKGNQHSDMDFVVVKLQEAQPATL